MLTPALGACLLAWACTSVSPAKSPNAERGTPDSNAPTAGHSQSAIGSSANPPNAATTDEIDITPKPPPTTEALVPLLGQQAPTALVAAAPGGHWAVLCEAVTDADGDGKLAVRLTQHGEFEGDPLEHALYANGTRVRIDEFAGSDPTGRYVAYVVNRELYLLDTVTDRVVALTDADTRSTQASYQPLRSVTFSDDGRLLGYLRGETTSILVVRDLSRQTEQTVALSGSPAYRIKFTPGSRYIELQAPVRDTNKNGRLDWLSPLRKGGAPCPSPIPTYRVWQFPGDQPDVSLFDVETGKLSVPEGYVLAAGRFVVRRTEDRRLTAEEPGKPALAVSSKECNGRVLHVDGASGAVLFGCNGAWGQRRQMFLRTRDARVALEFDLAAYELDTTFSNQEPIVALYPGNQSLLLNVRTRERWPLLDGTQVLAVDGTTALIEREAKLTVVTLNPDATVTPKTGPVTRAPFSGVSRQGEFVAVGEHVFDLTKRVYLGRYAARGTPLAVSRGGDGLFPLVSATPTELARGPLVWHSPSKTEPGARR